MKVDEEGRIVLSRDALIPVGSALAAVVSILAAVMWLNGRLSDFDKRIDRGLSEITVRLDLSDERTNNRLARMEERAVERTNDRWTETDQRLWASEMRRRNPELNVPDVGEIGR